MSIKNNFFDRVEGIFKIMDVRIKANNVGGSVKILSSKSHLHRLILASVLADKPTKIEYEGTLCSDVLATIDCVEKIGANVKIEKNSLYVTPIYSIPKENVSVCCGESGSTLRFILPIFSALGVSYKVDVKGRLKSRPLSPLDKIMANSGITFSNMGVYPLSVSGKLNNNNFEIDGGVSSQFITGLLFCLPLLGGGIVKVKGILQSKPYIDITTSVLRKFGITVIENNNVYTVSGSYKSPTEVKSDGDWSNSAFFLTLGAISNSVKVQGLNLESEQGDKKIIKILKEMGALVEIQSDITVKKGTLKGVVIDASNIPDLVPILSVCASVSQGKTEIINAERLKLKESDRIASTVDMINSLGGCAKAKKDGIEIEGVSQLKGGIVNGVNDHRIVMASAIASAVSVNPVIIKDSQAVNKSYPDFFERLESLGFTFSYISKN